MRAKLCHIWLTLLLPWVVPLTAQYAVLPLGEEELPNVDRIHYVTETTDGYFWLTSERGLTRFDGASGRLLKVFDVARDTQFSNNLQSPLLPIADTAYWLATYEALHVFNPQTERFRSIRLTEHEEAVSKYYRIIQVDGKRGTLLVKAGEFLWEFDTRTEKYEKVAGPTNSVAFAPLGEYGWAGVGYSNTLEIFERTAGQRTYTRREITLPEILYTIVAGEGRSLWIGTRNGLARIKLSASGGNYEYQPPRFGASIEALLKHSDGTLWLALGGQGVARFDPVEDRITDRIGPADGLRGTNPRYLSEDRCGRVWAAQYGQGMDVITLRPDNFSLIPATDEALVSDLCSPDGQNVLAGNASGQISRYEAAPDLSTEPRQRIIYSKEMQPDRLKNLRFESSDRQLWAGNNIQLGRFNVKSGEFDWYDRPSYPNTHLFPASAGLLTILTSEGVMSVRPESDSLRLQPLSSFVQDKEFQYTGLFGLTDSTFLVRDNGVELISCVLREDTVLIRNRYHLQERLSVVLQWRDRVLLGTNEGLLEIRGDSIVPLLGEGPAQQPPDVRALIQDYRTNDLFLGTTRGLLRYQFATGVLTRFGQAEGLPAENFLQADPVQLDDGTIWMATSAGIVRFHPDSLRLPAQRLRPYVGGLWVNDIPQPEELTGGEIQRVERSYRKNSLSFRLGVVGLPPAGKGQVEYQLEDYDLAPVRVTRGETIRYPRLPPGEYSLRLTAIDGRGQASETTRLAVIISPAFWDTLWFRVTSVLALLLVAMIIYALLLRRERQKQARVQERETAIRAERDRIAGEVHDDLGGQLSSIMFISQELLLTDAAPTLNYELGRISELSQYSLHNIRDIIFALDNRRATVSDLHDQFEAAGQELFRDHRLNFVFKGHYVDGAPPLNSRQKRNLFSIIREAWHNTIKHAEASVIKMDFAAGADQLVISVADDGRGIAATPDNKTGGYGLENMYNKAEAIGGTLTVESAPGEGTTIHLVLPLTS